MIPTWKIPNSVASGGSTSACNDLPKIVTNKRGKMRQSSTQVITCVITSEANHDWRNRHVFTACLGTFVQVL